MQESALSLLPTWHNFYAIIGTAAASLTGLMFVVITLSASLQQRRSSDGIGAFSSPTVFHFEAALLIAALLSAPWPVVWTLDLLVGLCGIAGVVYVMMVLRRMLRVRRQSSYTPVLEDWVWYLFFPLACYLAIFVAAILLSANAALALFLIAAAALLLVFIGIHNAWDLVTFMSSGLFEPQEKKEK